MKKIALILLVAMVPFLTMAQKRSKKDAKSSKANVEYMMIRGVEAYMPNDEPQTGDVVEMALGSVSSETVKLVIAFDYGNLRNAEVKEMQKNPRMFRTMMSAVNAAAEKGWEFMHSNVILEDKLKIHYYYMKRNK